MWHVAKLPALHITSISSSSLNCRLDQLVVQKADGAVAFEWVPLSRRCRRLVLHGGLGQNAAQPDSLRQVGLHARVGGASWVAEQGFASLPKAPLCQAASSQPPVETITQRTSIPSIGTLRSSLQVLIGVGLPAAEAAWTARKEAAGQAAAGSLQARQQQARQRQADAWEAATAAWLAGATWQTRHDG